MGSKTRTFHRIGEVRKNNFDSLMEIYEYKTCRDMKVRFTKYGCIVPTNYQNFLNGKVKSPYDKSVIGIGYLGEGEYVTKQNGTETKQYQTWNAMLKRCYNDDFHKRHPTYHGCSVDEEWHNFQNFAKWYDDNFYKIDGETMNLDKDILVKGNKVYSPATCVFVPKFINLLFVKNNANRGEFPIGVRLNKISKKPSYESKCKDENSSIKFLGNFDTPEEAFKVYKIFKENVIKKVAEDYINKIPKKLYEAMMNYKVEIDD